MTAIQSNWLRLPWRSPKPEVPTPMPTWEIGGGFEAVHRVSVVVVRPRKRGLAGVWARVLGVLAAILKWGGLLFKLGFFKATFISMAISVVVYSFFFGPAFAAVLVGLIFVHEMGHYLMAKRMRMDVSTPMFIPLLGAVIGMKRLPGTVIEEAKMAVAGPAVGLLAGGVALLAAVLTGSKFSGAVAYEGCFLTLFNLMPVMPLDGGRVTSAVSKWAVLVGLLGLIAFTAWSYAAKVSSSPILILIIVFSLFSTWGRFRQSKLQPEYLSSSGRERLAVGLGYLSIVVLAALGMALASGYLTELNQIVK